MRILVTGAKGMLGTDLCQIYRDAGHSVTPTDIQEMDVRDTRLVMSTVGELQPEAVLHLAALTDVDGCERDPEAAFRTNAIGTQNVALACQRFGADLVYISTLSVFNGEKAEAYTEFDQPDPHSWYSRSKYQGELFVQRLLSRAYIVRAGWMFGGGPEDKKFVAKIIELARSRPQLKVVNDKFGSPTYTRDFAAGILRLLGTGLYGTYHMVNIGAPASRAEVARRILEYAGITNCELLPVSSAEFPLPAPRPRMEAGCNYMLKLHEMQWMRPWENALQDYILTTMTVHSPAQ